MSGYPDSSNPYISTKWEYGGKRDTEPPKDILHRFSMETGGGYIWIYHEYHLRWRYRLIAVVVSLITSTIIVGVVIRTLIDLIIRNL